MQTIRKYRCVSGRKLYDTKETNLILEIRFTLYCPDFEEFMFSFFKFNVSWSVRASSYIPIIRPRDATCDRFLFSIYMCITLHVSSVKPSSLGVPHRTYSLQFLCLCLSAALSCKKSFLQDSAADRHKHRNWRLYVR
jgi:hypothetical protein